MMWGDDAVRHSLKLPNALRWQEVFLSKVKQQVGNNVWMYPQYQGINEETVNELYCK